MYYSRCCCFFFYITERISRDNFRKLEATTKGFLSKWGAIFNHTWSDTLKTKDDTQAVCCIFDMKTVRGSWQENERSLKILARKWKILEDLDKNFEDPWRSWQENEISLKILTRILKIFKGSHKDLLGSLKILQRFSSGMCHNRAKNIESARRIGTFFSLFW